MPGTHYTCAWLCASIIKYTFTRNKEDEEQQLEPNVETFTNKQPPKYLKRTTVHTFS